MHPKEHCHSYNLPEGRGNSSQTQGHGCEGGKAIPVEEQVQQHKLPLVTAENPRRTSSASPEEANRKRAVDESTIANAKEPQASVKDEPSTPASIQGVTMRLDAALQRVAANRGAPGPDGMTCGEARKRWSAIKPKLCRELIEGTYRPGDIRQAMIPKDDKGAMRKLGIPNVIDRVVQEAVRHEIEPLFEPLFHK